MNKRHALEAHNILKFALQFNIDRLSQEIKEEAEEVADKDHQRWINAGGCTRCNGWGTVIRWSTLDGAGFDEHEPCGCPASRAGPNPLTAYHNSSNNLNFRSKVTYGIENGPDSLRSKFWVKEGLVALQECKPVRESTVIVVKGRKVEPGTIGTVVSIVDSQYGPTMLIAVADSQPLWVSAQNTEVLLVRACTENENDNLVEAKRAACEAFIKNQTEYYKNKGIKKVVPDLEKIAWFQS